MFVRVRACAVVAILALVAGLLAVLATPVPSGATPVNAFQELSAGGSHTCAILTDGSVKCWGLNDKGQLGLGDTANRGDAAGEMGADLPAVDLGTGRTAVAISAGTNHTCALLDNASVKCWGFNQTGELGLGDVATRGDGPGEMGDALPAVDLGTGRTAVAVSAAQQYTCAVLDNGSVKCWGSGFSGKLGQGDTANRGDGPGEMGDALPAVSLGTGRTAVAVAAGGFHTCVLLDNAGVKCWGAGGAGALGQGSNATLGDGPNELGDNLPAINLGTGRTAMATTTGTDHTCALLDNGSVKCWGQSNLGQLGIGVNTSVGGGPGSMGDSLPAVDLGMGRTAIALTTRFNHTCAVLDDGSVKCWGWNVGGQLGLGDTDDRGEAPGDMGDALPAVSLGTGRTALAVTAGITHTCVRLDDGTVKCWGISDRGQLGQGDTTTRGDGPGEMGDALPTLALVTPAPAMTVVLAGAPASVAIGGDLDHQLTVTNTGNVALTGFIVPTGCTALPSTLLPGDDETIDCTYVPTVDDAGTYALSRSVDSDQTAAVPSNSVNVSVTVPPGQTLVKGVVTATIFGNPVVDADVLVLNPTTGRPIGSSDRTDSSGRYALLVPAGSGLLLVADTNNAHISAVDSSPTAFPDGGTVTANRTLTRYLGGIEGRAVDQTSGSGIPGAIAIAIDAATGKVRGAAVADSLGFWVIRNLRSVKYHVYVVDPTGAHEPRYYNNASTVGTASPVSVVGGALQVIGTSQYPAQTAPTGSTVEGTVTEPGGQALTGIAVLVYDATTEAFEGAATTDGNGHYSVTVDAGDHVVQFVDLSGARQSEWYADQRDGTIDDATPVTDGGTADAQLGPANVTVTGVVREQGTNDPLEGIVALAIDDAGIISARRTNALGVMPDMTLPPGPTRLWFVDPSRTHLPEYFDSRTGRGLGHDQGVTELDVVAGSINVISPDPTLVRTEATSPTATIATPADGATFDQGEVVDADYECADADSGVDTCVGDVADGSPIDTSAIGAFTFTVTATDNAGNTVVESHDYSVVDGTDPTATITTPADGATFDRGEVVNADFSCADETLLDTCIGDVADGSPIDTSTLGPQEFSVTATDAAGNTVTVTHDYTVVDGTDPTATITTPPDGATYDQGQVVAADFSCSDETDGSGLDTCVGDVADGSPIDTSTLGANEFSVTATDDAGNTATVTHDYTVVDGTDPTVMITTPAQNATFDRGQVVNANYGCSDGLGGSGIDTCVGDVAFGQPIDTSTLGAQDFSVTATDVAGNSVTVTHDYTVVDGTDPTATITTPLDGATITRGAVVDADFSCSDESGGSGLDSCVGDEADGDPIDTSTLGAHTFSVTATDDAGNTTTVTHDYTVVPATCFGEDVSVDLRFGEVPTNGRNVILGTPGADAIRGLGGADLICGAGGEDDLRGGAGLDRIRGGNDADHLTAGPGGGLLAGNAGDDLLTGGQGKDTLRGGPGADDLRGGPGNDLYDGGPDEDSCFLLSGRDTTVSCEAIAIP